MRFLGMVEAYAGRLEPIDSPRGESIFVTWSPKIFIEASAWRAYAFSGCNPFVFGFSQG